MKRIRKEKDALEDRLLADDRDWGEVRDAQQIEKRLRDMQQLRNLADRIVDVEVSLPTACVSVSPIYGSVFNNEQLLISRLCAV